MDVGVNAVHVTQLQRAHREVEAELHRLVDVGRGGNAFFEHPHALKPHHRVSTAGDEAGGIHTAEDDLAIEVFGVSASPLDLPFVRLQACDQLDQPHHHRRIEEVDADEPVGVSLERRGDGVIES